MLTQISTRWHGLTLSWDQKFGQKWVSEGLIRAKVIKKLSVDFDRAVGDEPLMVSSKFVGKKSYSQ